MNAKEARQKALSINEGRNKLQYQKVVELIEKAVEDGKFEVNFYLGNTSLTSGVDAKLKEDGFKVTSYSDQRDWTTITIRW